MPQVPSQIIDLAQKDIEGQLGTKKASGYVRGQCRRMMQWLTGQTRHVDTDITCGYAIIVCKALEKAMHNGRARQVDVEARLKRVQYICSKNEPGIILATKL